jgi:hypothetical protein
VTERAKLKNEKLKDRKMNIDGFAVGEKNFVRSLEEKAEMDTSVLFLKTYLLNLENKKQYVFSMQTMVSII